METLIKAVLGQNFKTSFSGLILAIGMAGATIGGVPERYKWIFGILAAVGAAGLGASAKDATTSSTLAEVEEATRKAEKEKVGGKL